MVKKVTKKYQAGGTTRMSPSSIAKGPAKKTGSYEDAVKRTQDALKKGKGPGPVGPGNTAKTPKPYRKGTPTMQPPMKKGGSMRGKSC